MGKLVGEIPVRKMLTTHEKSDDQFSKVQERIQSIGGKTGYTHFFSRHALT